jgi:hypothetical protein
MSVIVVSDRVINKRQLLRPRAGLVKPLDIVVLLPRPLSSNLLQGIFINNSVLV